MKNKFRYVVGVLIAAALVGISFYIIRTMPGIKDKSLMVKTLEKEDIDKAITINEATSVKVMSKDLCGSGNIIEITKDFVFVVSAGHIFDDKADTAEVCFFNNESRTGQIILFDSEKDICFIRIERDDKLQVLSVNPLDEDLKGGENVFIYDPYEEGATAGILAGVDTFVEDFNMNMLYCYIDASSGMSGSGLFTADGHYAGMLLGGSQDWEAVCLDYKTIKEMFSKCK